MPSILVILPYVPFPLKRGTYQRVYHLAAELAQGWELDLFCLRGEDSEGEQRGAFGFARRYATAEFRHPPWAGLGRRLRDPLPTTVRHWESPAALAALREFVAGRTYDVVWFCDLVLWPYAEALFPDHPRLVLDRSRVDWLFQTEELRTLRLGLRDRLLRWENLRKVARLERLVYRRVAREIVCGEDDRTFLRARLGRADKVFVLPNGANERFFSADDWPPAPARRPTALFCGALDYTPNVDGLTWYFREVHGPIRALAPDFQLLVVGKNPLPELVEAARQPGVTLVGEVPDVRPWYQQSWLQVVPLRIGGGTRLKIVECLALGVPVVSTTLGAQGLDLRHGRDLLLADTPEDFAGAVAGLLRDPAAREGLGRAGRANVLVNYTWGALGERLRQHLSTL